ncbi:single-stranded DNA-binding protein [Streptomyces sp. AC495_CC817]|uniref:single-stranded DNA-binding protein n=1 Tax=Streptomyces sp. AC495_CC817 TaxID=2823900 RepID=UPI001C2635EC|nr:single-stranded DNA-binding protein [Streptomyces sp. AC495_CC817]
MTETLTILGRVATDPVQNQTPAGTPVTNFRLASSHRRFDAATQAWVDAGTNWYSVAAFRHLGEHVASSLRTGDSVIVTGRLKIRSWEAGEKHGTSVDIDADAIGHDLRWGTSTFRSAPRGGSPERRRLQDEGASTGQNSVASESTASEADAIDVGSGGEAWALREDDPALQRTA